MTKEQLIQISEKYIAFLEARGCAPIRFTTNGVLPSGRDALNHAFWMLKEVTVTYAWNKDFGLEKAMRWLGFAQGILWTSGQFSIDMMKDDNR